MSRPQPASPSRPPRVTIMGSYGYGNLGDELMLDGVISGLQKAMKNAKLTVISGNAMQTRESHHVRSLERGGGAVSRMRRYLELVRSDLLVVGGGNIRDQLPREGESSGANVLATWLEQVLLAHRIGVPTMCYAVSIGRVSTPKGRAALRECLDAVDVVTVREPGSAARISELGTAREVMVTADAAFSAIMQSRGQDPRTGLVVTLRHWYERGNYVENPEAFERMMGEIAAFCDAFIDRHHEAVWLVPFKATESDDDSDVSIHRSLKGKMRNSSQVHLLEGVPDLQTILGLFGSARLILGMRLHSVVIATALGTPWISINYDPKVRSFAEYAKQARFSLEIEELSSEKLSGLAQEAVDREDEISAALKSTSEQLRAVESRNAEAALEVVLRQSDDNGAARTVVRLARLFGLSLARGRRGDGR